MFPLGSSALDKASVAVSQGRGGGRGEEGRHLGWPRGPWTPWAPDHSHGLFCSGGWSAVGISDSNPRRGGQAAPDSCPGCRWASVQLLGALTDLPCLCHLRERAYDKVSRITARLHTGPPRASHPHPRPCALAGPSLRPPLRHLPCSLLLTLLLTLLSLLYLPLLFMILTSTRGVWRVPTFTCHVAPLALGRCLCPLLAAIPLVPTAVPARGCSALDESGCILRPEETTSPRTVCAC